MPPPPPPEPLHLEPLADLVPSAGLEWLVLARPSELYRSPNLRLPLGLLVPPAGLERLADYTGFDLRLADELALASDGRSTLYLVRVAHDPALVEARFRERLTDEPPGVREGSSVVRVSGSAGEARRSFAALGGSVVAFETGQPGLLRAAIAFARGRLKRARPALSAEPLASLARRLGDAPLRLYAVNPAREPWPKGAHGLLERAIAAGLVAAPSPDGSLRVRGALAGTWDDPPSSALGRLEATLRDVGRSAIGRLTSFGEPLVPFSFRGDRDVIEAEGALDAGKLAGGLHAMTSARLDELFPPRAPRPPGPAPRPAPPGAPPAQRPPSVPPPGSAAAPSLPSDNLR
ncbi:MAG TPA: hypothetical protein VFS43_07485 [Polyangiaceae bacterium]|nr:hypothetical protein [Polyangiaceae bacterium]